MIHLYDFELSGNAHKIRNQLSLLELPHQLETVDLLAGEQRSPEFLRLNPFGKVPVLVDDDVVVRESGAILVYLGRKYGRGSWLPVDAEGEARVQEWLAIAGNEVASGPGFARLIEVFGAEGDIEAARKQSYALLERFEDHLSENHFLAGDSATIADIANYSYIALAPDGGVSLDAYPAVREWLERLEKLPGFEPVPVKPQSSDE